MTSPLLNVDCLPCATLSIQAVLDLEALEPDLTMQRLHTGRCFEILRWTLQKRLDAVVEIAGHFCCEVFLHVMTKSLLKRFALQ